MIFPPPTVILSSFFLGIFNGEYTKDTVITLARLLTGFAIGGSFGLILGFAMGWSRTIRRIFDPIVAAVHPIPKFALFPMILIIFGLGESSRNVMVAIAAFFPIVINTMVGVMQINQTYFEVVENYGGNKWDTFKKVVLPGSLPLMFSGVRISFEVSLTIAISVEIVYGTTGLGSILWLAWETMRITKMYSVLLIVAFIGICSRYLIELARKKVTPWYQEVRTR